MATALALRKRKSKNIVAQAWNYLPPQGKAITVGVGVVGVYFLQKNIRSKIADKKQKAEMDKLTEQFNTKFVVTTGHGQGAVVNLDLAKAATGLHDALNYGIGGYFTDDESIMRILLPIPKPYIQSLEYIYKKVYGDSLDEKLKKGMWRYNYNQIRYLFL